MRQTIAVLRDSGIAVNQQRFLANVSGESESFLNIVRRGGEKMVVRVNALNVVKSILRLNCLSRRRILLAARAFARCMLPASRSGSSSRGTPAPVLVAGNTRVWAVG